MANVDSTETRTSKHLKLAVQYVGDRWFPVNSDLFKKIQTDLTNGSYENDIDLLLNDLKKDFSLYMYCLKELSKMARAETESNNASELANTKNPLQLIKQANLNTLKTILSTPENKISAHSFKEISANQAKQIQSSLISAGTAEVLSIRYEIDPEAGFSAALLRQLGLTLIAWNYPHVYNRSVVAITPQHSLDDLIDKVLGFSPTLLGIQIASGWDLPTEIRQAIGERVSFTQEKDQSDFEIEKRKSVAEKLANFCEIGEALARANDPEHYPSAAADFKTAETQIKDHLGPKGLALIQKRIGQISEHYTKVNPTLFKVCEAQEISQKATTISFTKTLVAKNNYLKYCPPLLKENITDAYNSITPGQVSKDSIDILTKQAMPNAGFLKGCIYLVDPVSMRLIPRLKIGDVNLSRFKAVYFDSISSSTDPIATAFRCKTPILEENVFVNNEKVTYVAGVIGTNEKAGVLYLEVSSRATQTNSQNALVLFKAIRQALNESLNLG